MPQQGFGRRAMRDITQELLRYEVLRRRRELLGGVESRLGFVEQRIVKHRKIGHTYQCWSLSEMC